jgi:cell division protein FtsI/penicillin-binding protein 2
LTVTPLQAANIMAVYATGKYRPVSIVQDADPTHQWTLPGSSAQWAAIRKGIFGVVNDPDGTAYKYAHFEHPDYVLCGKTGSATTASWPTAFRVVIGAADGSKHEVVLPARTRQDAIDAAMADWPGHGIDPAEVEVVRRWPRNPPTDDRYSHAWFAGYLQAVDADHHPIWSTTPRIAFAVLVEFGGSGGRTSGPLANRVAREILDLYGPELKVDPPSSFRRTP